MQRYIILLLTVLLLAACGNRHRKSAIQGDWYKEGFDIKAFSVRGDSIYYPGLKKGYAFELSGDTLLIHFSKTTTKSKILSASNYELTIWDMSLSRDTIQLKRTPSIIEVTNEEQN